jgi:hypothetical protein
MITLEKLSPTVGAEVIGVDRERLLEDDALPGWTLDALDAHGVLVFRERRQEYEQRVEAVLRAGIRSGEFRRVDPWLTARAWLGMHNYTYLWLKPGGRLSARDTAKPFADIFIKGIAKP